MFNAVLDVLFALSQAHRVFTTLILAVSALFEYFW
jgi:hypothetical protein